MCNTKNQTPATPEYVQSQLVKVLGNFIKAWNEKNQKGSESLLPSYWLYFFQFDLDNGVTQYPQMILTFFSALLNDDVKKHLKDEMADNFDVMIELLKEIANICSYFSERPTSAAEILLAKHRDFGVSDSDLETLEEQIRHYTALTNSLNV